MTSRAGDDRHLGILFATDGSSGAQDALALMASSFEPQGVSGVDVLTVVPDLGSWRAGKARNVPMDLLRVSQREAAEKVASEAAERLRGAGFRVTSSVLAGHPAAAIIDRAAETQAGLVFLGTRGLGGPQRQAVGSVSAKVARYARSAVLVACTPGPIRQLLLAYDASPDADGALTLVAALPLRGSPLVTVCSAYDVPGPLPMEASPSILSEFQAAHGDSVRWAREAAEVMASEAASRLAGMGIQAVPRVAHGSPHEALAVLSSELPADLLAIGPHGLSGVQRFFLGSTSASLISHPPTSVLIARDVHG